MKCACRGRERGWKNNGGGGGGEGTLIDETRDAHIRASGIERCGMAGDERRTGGFLSNYNDVAAPRLFNETEIRDRSVLANLS